MRLNEWRSSFDWSVLNDSEIARRSGRTRSRIGQVREALGLGPPVGSFHVPSGTSKSMIAAGDWSGKSSLEVAEACGCSEEHARQCLGLLGKDYDKPPDGRCRHKYDWFSLSDEEWEELSDPEIADRLGVPNPAVVSQWRRRQRISRHAMACVVEGA